MAVRQIVSEAVASEEVLDIFSAAGLKKPDISILSDEFLAEEAQPFGPALEIWRFCDFPYGDTATVTELLGLPPMMSTTGMSEDERVLDGIRTLT